MIVAEIRNKKSCDREDWYILSRKHSENTQITYILSLGVFKEYRRLGVGESIDYFCFFCLSLGRHLINLLPYLFLIFQLKLHYYLTHYIRT